MTRQGIARWMPPARSLQYPLCSAAARRPASLSPRSQLMPVLVQKQAPDFTATAVVNEEFKQVQLSDYRGKYVVLFFYPLNFTFVCPTEIVAFSDRIDEFHERGAEVLGASVD